MFTVMIRKYYLSCALSYSYDLFGSNTFLRKANLKTIIVYLEKTYRRLPALIRQSVNPYVPADYLEIQRKMAKV